METQQKKRKVTVVETTSGDIAVYGAELVGRKALTNMAIIFNAFTIALGGHDVKTVVFSTDTPKKKIATCSLDSGTVSINVMETFCEVFEACIDKPSRAAGFVFWHNIYVSFIHEALHLQNPATPEAEITEDAVQILYLIVKEFDIEPGESRFLVEQMSEALLNGTDPIILKQKQMWESGTSFDDGKLVLTDYHEFVHLMSGDDEKHPEWAQKPKNKFIPITQTHDPITAPAVVTPVAEAVVEEPNINQFEAILQQMMGGAQLPPAIQAGLDSGLINEFEVDGDTDIFDGDNDPTAEEMASAMFEDGSMEEEYSDNPSAEEIASAVGGDVMPPQYVSSIVSATPRRIPATPEQLGQIKAFIMAGNAYLPEEHSNIGTPEQMLALTEEMLADITARMGMRVPVSTPIAYTASVVAQPTATVSMLQENVAHEPVRILPRTGLTSDQTAEIVKGVYTKCFNTIFGNCGQLLNSAVGFSYPDAVKDIPIILTPEEHQVVVGYNYHGGINPNSGKPRWCESTTEAGTIIGFVGSGQSLPSYKLYINMDGYRVCRFLIPQNPNKMKDGVVGPKAVLARKGMAIMYVMEGDDDVKKAGGKQWLYKAVIGRTNFNVPAVATNDSWVAQ